VNSDTANWVGVSVQLLANGRVIAQTYASLIRHQVSSASISGFDPQPQAGTNTYTLRLVTDPSYPGSVNASRCSITAVGGKR